jgi:hypothetical protein
MSVQNPFKPFPRTRGPLKLFVFGEPGTWKTRRALAMPGPLFVIDMESGSTDYGAMVNPDRDQHLLTKSVADVRQALAYLAMLKRGEVGTLVIDPVTVIWDQLQFAMVEKIAAKRRVAPEDAILDQGAWATLKRSYNDLMNSAMTAPYHVVMIARGKDKKDKEGNVIGYAYEGQKSTEFLANVVIEAHAQGDVVKKDRTGTFKDATRSRERVPFTAFLPNTGDAPSQMQSDSEAVRRDVESDERPAREEAPAPAQAGHHPEWDAYRGGFMAKLGELGVRYEDLAGWTQSNGWGRPSAWPKAKAHSLADKLVEGEPRRGEFDAWLAARSESSAAK